MRALLQLAPLLLILLYFARGNLRRFFLLSAIVTIPLRVTYAFDSSEHAGWTDGFQISISDIFFVLFAFTTALRGTMAPNHLNGTGIRRAMALFALASALSMINSASMRMTMWQIIMLVQIYVVFYSIIVRCVTDRDDLNAALMGVSISLLLQGVVGCIQFALQQNFLLFSTGTATGHTITIGADTGSTWIRVFGTVGKPNGYAMTLAPLLLLNISLLTVKELVGRRLRSLSVTFGFLGLIFSGSRGGWLSFTIAATIFIMILIWRLKGRRMRLLFSIGVLLVLVAVVLGPFVMNRVKSDEYNAAGSRVPLVRIAAEMIKDHPVVGVGANTYQNVMRTYLPKDWGDEWVGQVHNAYLLVAAEMGIVGFFAGFFVLRSLFKEGTNSFRQAGDEFQTALGLGLILVVIQACAHGMVEAYISKSSLSALFVLAAIITASHKLLARNNGFEELTPTSLAEQR